MLASSFDTLCSAGLALGSHGKSLYKDCTGNSSLKQAVFFFSLAHFRSLWHNTVMRRWFLFFIIITIGAAVGMLYGWVINPVKYVDTAPDSLRMDYKTDYVLMVSEAYRLENNLNLAARRLALLGTDTPEETVSKALEFARQIGYNESDIALIQSLADGLKTWNPSLEAPPP
jgi:hypothetical protein